jgi:hypothetical protein
VRQIWNGGLKRVFSDKCRNFSWGKTKYYLQCRLVPRAIDCHFLSFVTLKVFTDQIRSYQAKKQLVSFFVQYLKVQAQWGSFFSFNKPRHEVVMLKRLSETRFGPPLALQNYESANCKTSSWWEMKQETSGHVTTWTGVPARGTTSWSSRTQGRRRPRRRGGAYMCSGWLRLYRSRLRTF